MQRRTVAVDAKLDHIRDLLQRQGYEVVGLDAGRDRAAAVVLSGMEENVLGIETRSGAAGVIDARGLTPDEILDAVRRFTGG